MMMMMIVTMTIVKNDDHDSDCVCCSMKVDNGDSRSYFARNGSVSAVLRFNCIVTETYYIVALHYNIAACTIIQNHALLLQKYAALYSVA